MKAATETTYVAVWGNGRTGRSAGVLGKFPTLEEAKKAADDFRNQNDNPACGAWTCGENEEQCYDC